MSVVAIFLAQNLRKKITFGALAEQKRIGVRDSGQTLRSNTQREDDL